MLTETGTNDNPTTNMNFKTSEEIYMYIKMFTKLGLSELKLKINVYYATKSLIHMESKTIENTNLLLG